MKSAWVLRAKSYKEDGMSVYFGNEEPTTDLQDAFIIHNKREFLEWSKAYEKEVFERFGKNAVCNGGYTNITTNFEFVEVELEESK